MQPHIEWSRSWLKNALELPVRHDNSRALLIARSETMKKQIDEQQKKISMQEQLLQQQSRQLNDQQRMIEELQRQTEELQRQTEELRRGFVTRVEKKIVNVIGRIKKT